MLTFKVLGIPQPGGSKRAFVIPGTNRARVTDANAKAAPWKAEDSCDCWRTRIGAIARAWPGAVGQGAALARAERIEQAARAVLDAVRAEEGQAVALAALREALDR